MMRLKFASYSNLTPEEEVYVTGETVTFDSRDRVVVEREFSNGESEIEYVEEGEGVNSFTGERKGYPGFDYASDNLEPYDELKHGNFIMAPKFTIVDTLMSDCDNCNFCNQLHPIESLIGGCPNCGGWYEEVA